MNEQLSPGNTDPDRHTATPPEDSSIGATNGQNSDRRQQAIQRAKALLGALGIDELFRSPQDEPFARFKENGHLESWPLRSDTFKRWLELRLYEMNGGEFPKVSTVNDVVRQLEGIARFQGTTRSIHLRVGAKGGKVYVDLCNNQWQVVEISSQGWQILNDSPIIFRRSPGMQALATPVEGGSVQELIPFINVGSRDQQILVLSWLVMALRPSGPYPILSIQGQQGSAKSTCGKILRSLIDPSASPLRTSPKDERDLMISAKHAHLVAFDNLSSIPNWLSDSFCRLATGGGLATRQLYSDERQVIFQASRPILINGIDDLAERGDLLDRVVSLNLPALTVRKNEDEFWREFEAACPRIIGALLTAVSAVLQRIETVQIPNLPRMADFGMWATAAEEALGFEPGEFLAAYHRNRREGSLHALDCSSVARDVIALVKQCSTWEGTHGELLSQLNLIAGSNRRDPDWPKSARKLSSLMARAEPDLVVAGIKFTRLPRQGGTGNRRIRLEICCENRESSVPACQRPS